MTSPCAATRRLPHLAPRVAGGHHAGHVGPADIRARHGEAATPGEARTIDPSTPTEPPADRIDDAGEVVEVDSLGKACPLPVIDLAAAVASHPVGTSFRLLADDPAAEVDVPVWCRMQRQQLDDVAASDDHVAFLVTKVRAST